MDKRKMKEFARKRREGEEEPGLVGKHRDSPDGEFDADELEMGTDHELEHTDDEEVAKEIAKDHLAEIPDYYTRLAAMEEEAGVEG